MTSTEPRKSPNQARARATVTAILDATARILAEDGFEAVNTNRVAEVAGVSVGSLYQYFPNKGALVGAVAVRHTEATAAVIAAGVHAAADGDLPGLVKALIRSTIQAHAANPKLRRAIIEELPRIGRPARIAELKRGIHQSVVALLTARRSRIKVKDIPMAAFVIINTVEHLTHAAELASYSARDLAQLERELNDFILAYLVSREN
ncbi:TetR/AcrR family transcriptional regulator [Bradyrhizobium sp.]|uniref:TetR/AcrR family transcriptional regulator n=1 Tax=Bradyrhizobium sp. TaxID=376 RepID=UPI003C76EEE3